MLMINIKQWYLAFLKKDKISFFEKFFYGFLCGLSYVYGLIVILINFLYDKEIISSYSCRAKVISIGNLCWSGSGKTTLSSWLYNKLSPKFKIAILRRGYGSDEGKLLEETTENVFALADRSKLAKNLESQFDLFILDDGFSHRKLSRDINIIIMGAREFEKKYKLIPAYFFREPLKSLKRADIVVLNYASQLNNPGQVKELISRIAPRSKVYLSNYQVQGFRSLKGDKISLELLKKRRIAAFCAIGYPEGFFSKLEEQGLEIVRRIVYPDHHELSEAEFNSIQDDLLKQDIGDLITTPKDKYHFPGENFKLNIFIMDINIEIEDEDGFSCEINKRLA
ncbi:MAG: tetraacyldisaccharide 4'-kinase [Candidatus Omnitrophota bacterium]